MRLIVDRPALVEAAQLGFGQVGNDTRRPSTPASGPRLGRTFRAAKSRAAVNQVGLS
jgi:hypothetical protein